MDGAGAVVHCCEGPASLVVAGGDGVWAGGGDGDRGGSWGGRGGVIGRGGGVSSDVGGRGRSSMMMVSHDIERVLDHVGKR